MKKLFAVLVVFAFLCGCYSMPKQFSLQTYFSGEYNSYTYQPIDKTSTNLGFCYINSQTSTKAIGESIKLNNYEPNAVLQTLKAKVVKCETLPNGANVIYAYTNKIKEEIDLNGNKVNLQLACYDNYCIVGWPLILGSY